MSRANFKTKLNVFYTKLSTLGAGWLWGWVGLWWLPDGLPGEEWMESPQWDTMINGNEKEEPPSLHFSKALRSALCIKDKCWVMGKSARWENRAVVPLLFITKGILLIRIWRVVDHRAGSNHPVIHMASRPMVVFSWLWWCSAMLCSMDSVTEKALQSPQH